ncbi:MAG TPA: PilZ domain-containing protein [Nitrospira sp.]|nr:PilZ domain-containing protein [Nitrospira sp.]
MPERRRFARYIVQCPIVAHKDGVMIGDGLSYDLSAGGCAVESAASVGRGDYVALHLYLPDHRDPTTPLQVELAAVRWTIQGKFGVEFITMSSEDQQRLRRYVETFPPGNP